jgi:hypothetical protein
MIRRLLAFILGVLMGLLSAIFGLLLLANDVQSWGDASAAGARLPSAPVILRLALHSVAFAFSLLALLGAVSAIKRPARAGILLLLSALGTLPLVDFAARLELRLGLRPPLLIPSLVLVIAALLALSSAPGRKAGAAAVAGPAPGLQPDDD